MKFAGYECIHLDWIKPLKEESLPAYARRLAKGIDTEPYALIGVSFGGMLLSEIPPSTYCKARILLSSTADPTFIPYIPPILVKPFLRRSILKAGNFIFKFISPQLFGVKDKESTSLLRKIIEETDVDFLAWALAAIIQWVRDTLPPKCLHIHGDNDKMLPAKGQQVDHLLTGGHFIVWERAVEIEAIIKSHLIKKS